MCNTTRLVNYCVKWQALLLAMLKSLAVLPVISLFILLQSIHAATISRNVYPEVCPMWTSCYIAHVQCNAVM